MYLYSMFFFNSVIYVYGHYILSDGCYFLLYRYMYNLGMILCHTSTIFCGMPFNFPVIFRIHSVMLSICCVMGIICSVIVFIHSVIFTISSQWPIQTFADGVQITKLVTTLCYVVTIHCIGVSLNRFP